MCRTAGAKNMIVAGGLDWAYDLSGVAKGYALADPQGNGVVYDTHIYPWKKNWDRNVTVVLDKHPVLVGEAGCQPGGRDEDPKTCAESPGLHRKAPAQLDGLGPAPGGRAVPDSRLELCADALLGGAVKKALRAAAAKRGGRRPLARPGNRNKRGQETAGDRKLVPVTVVVFAPWVWRLRQDEFDVQ